MPQSSPRVISLRASVAAMPLMLAACVGGGGGGGGGAANDPGPSTGATTPPPSFFVAGASAFENSEYSANRINPMMNASAAYARARTGSGVTVAIVDGLLDPAHPELGGRVLSVNDFTGGDSGGSAHGMAVAGVVAAARDGRGVHGVAFDANLRSYGIISQNGTIPYDGRVVAAFNQIANDNVRIVNNSWGGYTGTVPANDQAAMQALVEDGAVLVWAAGNNASTTPTRESILPTTRPELEKGWLVVTSVDADYSLSSFASHCGAAAQWCLSAPGNRIRSIGSTPGTLVQASGTSFAAPAASGALAVLMDTFPSLTAHQARDILLMTAAPLGDEKVFGRGLIDLERATRPVGSLGIPANDTVSGDAFALAGSGLAASAPMGDGPARALTDRPVMVLDAFARPYGVTLSAGTARDAFEAEASLGGFDRPVAAAGGSSALASGGDRLSLRPELGPLAPDRAASFSGLTRQGARQRQEVTEHPFLGRLTQGSRVSVGRGGLTMSVGGDGTAMGGALTARRSGDGDLGVAVGVLREADAVLGASGSGALAINGTTTTSFASVAWRQPLGGVWAMVGGLHLGHSRLDGQKGSLVRGFDGISSSGAVALERHGTVRPNGVLSFTIAQPLRMERGGFDLAWPVARSVDGAVRRDDVRIDAVPTGREVNLELGWSGSVRADGSGGRLSGSVLHRLNPGHRADAQSETVVMGRYGLRF